MYCINVRVDFSPGFGSDWLPGCRPRSSRVEDDLILLERNMVLVVFENRFIYVSNERGRDARSED